VNRVFVGLGSNLSHPAKQIDEARSAIKQLDDVGEIAFSSLYRTPPMGPQDQPDYLNAVMEIEVALTPLSLLDALQAIELSQGRVRKDERWGARSIDLDILLYGEEVVRCERLVVPHYGIADRSFVLYPLQEISPDLVVPKLGSLAELVDHCDSSGLMKL
jgi:2-amino-4-hydroxy-6-hydroxymethyldihydropteridine diphosphokinase